MQRIIARGSVAVGALASIVTIVSFVTGYFSSDTGSDFTDPIQTSELPQLSDRDYSISLKNTSSHVVWIIEHQNVFQKKKESDLSPKDAFPFLEMNKDISNVMLSPGETKEIFYEFKDSDFKKMMFQNFRMWAKTCYCIEKSTSCWIKTQYIAPLYSQRNVDTQERENCQKDNRS